MEIVIVPAWRRPAFLAATLHRLAIALEGEPAVHIHIWLDRRHDVGTARVANAFVHPHGSARVEVRTRSHPYRGNSYNVLQAYKAAIFQGVDLIHLVEEDVLISADYFAFHRAAYALDAMPLDVMAVSAARNQNHPGDPDPDPTALYLGTQYQSVAVSFQPHKLHAVLEHAVPAYFHDPIGYCRKHFPRSKIPAGNAEQDGLVNRVVEQLGMSVAYAAAPRAYHAGFTGYHRAGAKLEGSIERQADRILAMTTAEMNAAAFTYPDHQVVDLDARSGLPSRMIVWP